MAGQTFALQVLVAANPRLMAGYDLLARCHEALGNQAQAQKILEEAVAISPHMVRRLRKLGEVALEAGDAAAAEKSFKQVVSKARYSEFRDPEDHVRLVKALVKRGDLAGASGVVRDLEDRRLASGQRDSDGCGPLARPEPQEGGLGGGGRAGAGGPAAAEGGSVGHGPG